jgi:excisionase family DNA binding protein
MPRLSNEEEVPPSQNSIDEQNPTLDLLTVEQSAEFLHVSTSTIRTYMRCGRLKGYRIAGRRKLLIPRAGLMALLQPTN